MQKHFHYDQDDAPFKPIFDVPQSSALFVVNMDVGKERELDALSFA